MKKLGIIICMMAILFVPMQAQKSSNPNGVWEQVEQLPEFKGGQEGLQKYLMTNVHYPDTALTLTGTFRPVVSFIVEKDGTLSHIYVAQSSGYDFFDQEALKAVEQMPKWKPGKQRGEKVRVHMMLPVSFTNIGQNE